MRDVTSRDTPMLTAESVLSFTHVHKSFKSTTALSDVSLEVPRGTIVGLVGRNGCGKTTLLHHVTGLMLPTSGTCTTFGVSTNALGAREHARMGVVHQHAKLLGWMRVEQLLQYIATFYESWDVSLSQQLTDRLQLSRDGKVAELSPGNVQKLSLVLALSHRPELLLLDEPLSDLDPTARQDVLAILLEYFSARECTIVISSHLLHDIEPMVNRIICLEQGHVTANADLDTLKESYAEWIVTARGTALPSSWSEPGIVRAQGDASQARLIVHGDVAMRESLRASMVSRYDIDIESRALNLERLFPVLTGDRTTPPERAHAIR